MFRILLSILIVFLLTNTSLAGTIKNQDHLSTMRLVETFQETFLWGNVMSPGMEGARTDTRYLLGSPLGNVDFQDEDGEPAWEGETDCLCTST